MNTQQTISFIGAGDCGPVHGAKDGFPVERYSELVRPTLATADIRFVNCERQYSSRGEYARAGQGDYQAHGRQPPEMADILTHCGFDAATIANNHMWDFGADAMLDTRALLESKGIQVTGAGKTLAQARQPAIVERKGIKVGFLGYTSIFPVGSTATANKPGMATIRVKTAYETRGPHAPVRVITQPVEEDLRMVVDDITALRKEVDILMVAFHWGVIWVPRVIADYQVAIAHACIDAGADLIMGHHAHIPKGIEVYKGKSIFYSLSNFCMTKPTPSTLWAETPWHHGALRNHTDQDPNYPLLPYGRDGKRSLLVKAILSKKGVERVSFLPMMIDQQYRPEVLKSGDPRFDDMVSYMSWTSEGLNHRFEVAQDEIIVESGANS
jgi:poly-gamma-glutamate capsule biosynthesis protein CapA/YwtB (metallophosphatase superfamily)